MQELLWLKDFLPESKLEGGVALVNQLYWYITVRTGGGKWCVFSGEKAVLCTDSREAVEAFLYGMGLAYAIFPPDLFERLRADVEKLVGLGIPPIPFQIKPVMPIETASLKDELSQNNSPAKPIDPAASVELISANGEQPTANAAKPADMPPAVEQKQTGEEPDQRRTNEQSNG